VTSPTSTATLPLFVYLKFTDAFAPSLQYGAHLISTACLG